MKYSQFICVNEFVIIQDLTELNKSLQNYEEIEKRMLAFKSKFEQYCSTTNVCKWGLVEYFDQENRGYIEGVRKRLAAEEKVSSKFLFELKRISQEDGMFPVTQRFRKLISQFEKNAIVLNCIKPNNIVIDRC